MIGINNKSSVYPYEVLRKFFFKRSKSVINDVFVVKSADGSIFIVGLKEINIVCIDENYFVTDLYMDP